MNCPYASGFIYFILKCSSLRRKRDESFMIKISLFHHVITTRLILKRKYDITSNTNIFTGCQPRTSRRRKDRGTRKDRKRRGRRKGKKELDRRIPSFSGLFSHSVVAEISRRRNARFSPSLSLSRFLRFFMSSVSEKTLFSSGISDGLESAAEGRE